MTTMEDATTQALLVEHFARPMLEVLGAIVAVLGSWVLHRLRRVLKMRESEELDRAWERLVELGVAYAEQRAKEYLKGGLDGEPTRMPLTGANKRAWAIDWIEREAHERGLVKLARVRLDRLIEAKLGGLS
jgi:hypothetical protein